MLFFFPADWKCILYYQNIFPLKCDQLLRFYVGIRQQRMLNQRVLHHAPQAHPLHLGVSGGALPALLWLLLLQRHAGGAADSPLLLGGAHIPDALQMSLQQGDVLLCCGPLWTCGVWEQRLGPPVRAGQRVLHYVHILSSNV